MSQETKLFPNIVNHDLYFAIAAENLKLAIQADTKIEEGTWTSPDGFMIRAVGMPFNQNNISFKEYRLLEKKICKAATVSLIFAMLTMEVWVNYYGSDVFSKTQLDKLGKNKQYNNYKSIKKRSLLH